VLLATGGGDVANLRPRLGNLGTKHTITIEGPPEAIIAGTIEGGRPPMGR